MNITALYVWLSLSLIAAGCGLARGRGTEFSRTRANELVLRNLLAGQDRHPIEAPRAYQYGNVHVDGPTGGILYRFASNVDALQWMVDQHRLHEVRIDSPSQLPLDFLDDRPQWWDPWQANISSYYILVEGFPTGGERQLIVIFDLDSGVLYAVEHFSGMPGI